MVVSCRSHRWLPRCLASVVDQADEVILVDNGSPGPEVAEAGRRAGAVMVRLATNAGFAAGVNAGLRRARGEVVGLLNDDAVASGDWVASAAVALKDQDVAAVGPKILFASSFAEIRLDTEAHFAPGDPRPLGQSIFCVEVDGVEVPLGGLRGPGVHRLEHRVESGVSHHWRWTAGTGPIFVPVPDDCEGSAVTIDGAAVPVVQLVDLVANAGCYLSTYGHGGDYGFALPDDGTFDDPAERFGTTGAAMVATA